MAVSDGVIFGKVEFSSGFHGRRRRHNFVRFLQRKQQVFRAL